MAIQISKVFKMNNIEENEDNSSNLSKEMLAMGETKVATDNIEEETEDKF